MPVQMNAHNALEPNPRVEADFGTRRATFSYVVNTPIRDKAQAERLQARIDAAVALFFEQEAPGYLDQL